MVPPTFTVTTADRRVVRRSRVRPEASVARISLAEKSVPSDVRTWTSTPGKGSPLRFRARTRIWAWPPAGGSMRGSAHARATTGCGARTTVGRGVGAGVGGASGARGPESRKTPQPGAAIRTATRIARGTRAMNLWYAGLRGSVVLRVIVAGGGRGLADHHVVHVPAARAGHRRQDLRLSGHGDRKSVV